MAHQRKPVPRRSRPVDERGEQFDAWFPRVQRAVVLALGAGGIVYAAVIEDIGLASVFAGFVLWQGYQDLRNKNNGDGG